jgi:hypothetical protein
MAADFGGKPFSLTHYLSVKSAVELNMPAAIYFHYQYEPQGEWWQRTKALVTLNKITAPEFFMGRQLHHVAHKADVVRLQALKETGGIYLDLDTISVKPLTKLLQYSFAVGEELQSPGVPKNWRQKFKLRLRQQCGFAAKKNTAATGLCNAVLLSEKNSDFVNLWLNEYKSFRSLGRDKYWNEHSVKIPERLAQLYPESITRLSPYAFHYPLYNEAGLRSMFEAITEFPDVFIHHLWESFSWDAYLSRLS